MLAFIDVTPFLYFKEMEKFSFSCCEGKVLLDELNESQRHIQDYWNRGEDRTLHT